MFCLYPPKFFQQPNFKVSVFLLWKLKGEQKEGNLVFICVLCFSAVPKVPTLVLDQMLS